MNHDQPSRDEIEARLTALLLGELPDDEARLLRWTISQDAGLKKLHDRLQQTIGFVRAAVNHPAEAPGEKNVPLKLSDERRQKLLAHFKIPRPQPAKELFWLKRIEVPHLVAALAVVAIIAVLAAMMLPALASAKRKAQNVTALNMAKQKALEAQIQAEKNVPAVAMSATPSPVPPVLTAAQPPPAQIVLPQVQESSTGVPIQSEKLAAASPAPADAETETRVFRLKYGNPTDVAKEMSSIFQKPGQQNNQNAQPVNTMADPRIQAVVVTAPKDKMQTVASLMGELDVPSDRDQSVYVIKPQNGDPQQVAEVLQSMFQSGSSSIASSSSQHSMLQQRAQSGTTTTTGGTGGGGFGGGGGSGGGGGGNPFAANFGEVGGAAGGGSGGSSGGLVVGQVNAFSGAGTFRSQLQGTEGNSGGGAKAAAEAESPAAKAIQNSGTLASSSYDHSLSAAENRRIGSTDAASPGFHFNVQAGSSVPPSAAASPPTGAFPGNTAAGTDLALNDTDKQLFSSGLNGDSFSLDDTGASAPKDTFTRERFYRNNDVSGSDADKLPTSDDSPTVGRRIQLGAPIASPPAPTASPAPSSTPVATLRGFYDDNYSAGKLTEAARELPQSSGDVLALNSENSFSGGTTVNGRKLGLSDRDQNVVTFSLQNGNPQTVTEELRKKLPSGSSSLASSSLQNRMLQQRSQNASTTIAGSDTVGGTFLNNGTLDSANISVDPVTHNLIVITDKATENQIRQVIANLDATATTPPGNAGRFELSATNAAVLSDTFAVSGRNYITGLTRDDANGLKYLLTTNNSVRESAASSTNDITLNFQNAPLSAVLNYVSEEAGFIVVQDTPVHGNVSITSKHPVTKAEAVDLLNSALNQNGYAAIQDGRTLTIVNKNEAKTSDISIPKATQPAPIPQPEFLTRENAFSTFSMNVSDVSFKLAQASLDKGKMPDAASIRSEEFINAFDYRDPEAPAGVAVAFASGRARDPFAQNRDLLRFSIKTAASGRAAGRPLNLVLLLDVSGSMERADRVAIIRAALRVLASQLHPQDTVSVVTFARTARLWADGVSGDKAGETLSQVGGITPEGGTNLEEAMRLAYETARRHYLANGINRVVLLTDGAANLGNVDAAVLKQKVEAQRKQGIALDCFGIGWEDYNDDLLEQLSGNGDGRYAFLNSPDDAAQDFAAKLAGALQVAAEDVKVQVEFNPQRVTAWRQIGYATHQLTQQQFRDNSVLAAEIAAQEAGNALYTVQVNPQGDGPLATVRVRYKIPGTTEVREQAWDVPYTGGAMSLEQSSAAMRLAAVAGEFAEWLAGSPFVQEVTPDELLQDLSGVPEIYGADQRPKQLEMMIREAKSASGK
ncbi:MAG TPA: von Willebrand factor type A domain-containing protein [Verrucomicrobiae bacterium]